MLLMTMIMKKATSQAILKKKLRRIWLWLRDKNSTKKKKEKEPDIIFLRILLFKLKKLNKNSPHQDSRSVTQNKTMSSKNSIKSS
jgi:hypothetical protein